MTIWQGQVESQINSKINSSDDTEIKASRIGLVLIQVTLEVIIQLGMHARVIIQFEMHVPP